MKNINLKMQILEKFGTQWRFCQLTGLREHRVSAFINGRYKPNEEERRIIAANLGVKLNKLFPALNDGQQVAG